MRAQLTLRNNLLTSNEVLTEISWTFFAFNSTGFDWIFHRNSCAWYHLNVWNTGNLNISLFSSFILPLPFVSFFALSFQTHRGLWNVPYINQAYLIQVPFLASELAKQTAHPNAVQTQHALLSTFSFVPYELDAPDPELSFCRSLRENGIFMWLSNLHDYGHLVQSEGFATMYRHGELWEIHRNRIDWERRYLHANYSRILNNQQVIEQPCPDVFWFPIVSEQFCDHLVDEMESFGAWSGGKNEDPRLSTGYENVPTVDIHMKQIGFEQHWLYLLRTYIRPVQEKLFMGYFSDVSMVRFWFLYWPIC